MRRHVLVCAALCVAFLGCDDSGSKSKSESKAKSKAKTEDSKPEDEGAGSCLADPAWLTGSTLPTEVPGEGSLCDFDRFAWQSLLALVQPVEGSAALQFETWMPNYGIFVGNGQAPTAWGNQPPDPCSTQDGVASRKAATEPRVYSDLIKQAGLEQPLTAPDGKLVYYGMLVNEPAYDMLTGCELYRSNCAGPLKPGNPGIDIIGKYPSLAFPDGAVELKTSWKVLSAAERDSKLFYTTKGYVMPKADDPASCELVDLGLVGLHIVSKPPSTPSFVWATFEHRANAPACSDLAAKPPVGDEWSFFRAATCKNCNTNVYVPGEPAQVCRMHPEGDSLRGTFPEGKSCEAMPNQAICKDPTKAMLAQSSAAMEQINASVQLLIASSSGPLDPVWANYELVGNLWTKSGVLPPQLPSQVGSLSAANTSMETFLQNGEARQTNPNNCFSCHNQDSGVFGKTLPPAGLSHIFDRIIAGTGGCEGGSLPAACDPYTK